MISKANNGKGNNPSRDEWETPSWIFNPLMEQYGFEFDCCATKQNTKTKDFSEQDFQDIIELDKVAWMNPPFSKAYAMFRHFFKIVRKGVAIYRCDNLETALWQKEILPNCQWILIPDRRVSYEGLDGDGENSLFKKWKKNWKPYKQLPDHIKDYDREWADKILDNLPFKCPMYQCGGLMVTKERPYPKGMNEDDFPDGIAGDSQMPDLVCTNCKAVYHFDGFRNKRKLHKPAVDKPSLSQNNKKEDGFPPTPKGMGIQPTIL